VSDPPSLTQARTSFLSASAAIHGPPRLVDRSERQGFARSTTAASCGESSFRARRPSMARRGLSIGANAKGSLDRRPPPPTASRLPRSTPSMARRGREPSPPYSPYEWPHESPPNTDIRATRSPPCRPLNP
jgi:hypothetical protein